MSEQSNNVYPSRYSHIHMHSQAKLVQCTYSYINSTHISHNSFLLVFHACYHGASVQVIMI